MISRNTFIGDDVLAFEQSFTGRQARIWTALPGIVQSFDAEALTAVVQPAIQGKVRQEDGTVSLVNMPLLLDCPVVFPHAGGASITFPVKPGDECLVVFASRGIDYWWQSGGVQPPAETRMHDLSDGFCIPGPWSQPKRISAWSGSEVQVRSDDGAAYVAVNPTSHQVTAKTDGAALVDAGASITLKAPKVVIDSPITTVTGKLAVSGDISGAAQISDATGRMQSIRDTYNGHTHNGGSSPDQKM